MRGLSSGNLLELSSILFIHNYQGPMGFFPSYKGSDCRNSRNNLRILGGQWGRQGEGRRVLMGKGDNQAENLLGRPRGDFACQ